MNWTAGILALVLLYVPIMVILYRFRKQNKEIDRKYEERMEQIRKRYGVE